MDQRRNGFTLVEKKVTIAVLAILFAISVFSVELWKDYDRSYENEENDQKYEEDLIKNEDYGTIFVGAIRVQGEDITALADSQAAKFDHIERAAAPKQASA